MSPLRKAVVNASPTPLAGEVDVGSHGRSRHPATHPAGSAAARSWPAKG